MTSKYLETLEKDMLDSTISSVDEIKRRLRIEHDCGCLAYKTTANNNNNAEGIVGMAYYFTENSSQSRRITLMHVSTRSHTQLDGFLSDLIEFVFTKDNCEEIRMSLVHVQGEDGKLATHKHI